MKKSVLIIIYFFFISKSFSQNEGNMLFDKEIKYFEKYLDNKESIYIDSVIVFFKESANLNNKNSAFNLGQIYSQGIGVSENNIQAHKWYLKAANLNHINAQYTLGQMYLQGMGVIKDSTQAYKWFSKIIQQEVFKKKYVEGILYVVSIDLEKYSDLKKQKKIFDIVSICAQWNNKKSPLYMMKLISYKFLIILG